MNGHIGAFNFLKKKIEILFLVRVRTRYSLSLVFRFLVCSKISFSLKGIQIFGLETTSHGKPDLRNSFLRSDLPCEVVFQAKKLNTSRELELAANRAEPENQAGLVTGPDPDKKQNFKFFFQKIKSATMPVQHVKGQPTASTYV